MITLSIRTQGQSNLIIITENWKNTQSSTTFHQTNLYSNKTFLSLESEKQNWIFILTSRGSIDLCVNNAIRENIWTLQYQLTIVYNLWKLLTKPFILKITSQTTTHFNKIKDLRSLTNIKLYNNNIKH